MHIKKVTTNRHYRFLCNISLNNKTMKYLLSIFLCLLFSLSNWAGSPVKLDKKEKINDRHYESSINITIEQDHCTLYLSSNITINNLMIIIKDNTGGIVYTNIISIYSSQPYTLILPNMDDGKYTIDLISSEYKLSGDFYIDDLRI